MKTQKPSIFIGSSQEALKYAEAIKAKLQRVASPIIWSQKNIWRPGGAVLEDLINRLPGYDFAVLILCGEDVTKSRQRVRPSPRDNIILELGLFMGHLGRFRTFFLCRQNKEDEDLKIPTNLNGITYIRFEGTPNQANKAVASACQQMRQEIRKQGVHKPSAQPSNEGSGPVGEAVFNWMKLTKGARDKLARSQFIRAGGTKDALMTLVKSARSNYSILAICGYKGDFSRVYYKENFKKCKAVRRVFSYEAIRSEITVKKVSHALDGLKMHLDARATKGCEVEVILIPKDLFIKDLGSRNFNPPLSFGLAILRDGRESPKKAVVHWEMDARLFRDLIAIEGVIIDGGQKEVLGKLVKLWEEIARSDDVPSSKTCKEHKSNITALRTELEKIWKSRCH